MTFLRLFSSLYDGCELHVANEMFMHKIGQEVSADQQTPKDGIFSTQVPHSTLFASLWHTGGHGSSSVASGSQLRGRDFKAKKSNQWQLPDFSCSSPFDGFENI